MTGNALLSGLLDDASLFPPASLAMPAALTGHARHAAAWYHGLCGPFVCADTRLPDLRTAMTASNTMFIDLALVVPGGEAAVAAALDAVAADPRLRLRAVEVPAARDADPARAVTAVATALDRSPLAAAAGYVEVPPGALADQATASRLLATIDDRGYRLKLRTGGITATAFPDDRTLAACLHAVAARRVPFKCTAGLHHAVRHTAADTGFEHHGFLNVLLAVGAAGDGADIGQIAGLLAERDPAKVAGRVSALDAVAVSDIRYLFTSFGTCSTSEPVADLARLGLLRRPG